MNYEQILNQKIQGIKKLLQLGGGWLERFR